MSSPPDEVPWSSEEHDGLLSAIGTILASLAGLADGFDLLSFSLQRTSYGDFRCILRGRRTGSGADGVRLVGFSNAGLPSECLLYAEHAFREGLIRWSIDRFASDNGEHDSSKDQRAKITYKSSAKF